MKIGPVSWLLVSQVLAVLFLVCKPVCMCDLSGAVV